MHENNDHILAEAWWVTLKSPDLFYVFILQFRYASNDDISHFCLHIHVDELKRKLSDFEFEPNEIEKLRRNYVGVMLKFGFAILWQVLHINYD